MNSALARLYGRGLDKTASDNAAEVDLTQISAADYLAMVQEQETPAVETEPEGELDLSQMSAQELLELSEQLDAAEGEKVASEQLDAMAQDGTLQQWDMVGRILAHAFADESEKLASAAAAEPEEFEVDLNEMSAEDLMAAIDAGYELVLPEAEKTAGKANALELYRDAAARARKPAEGLVSRMLGKMPGGESRAKLGKLRKAVAAAGGGKQWTNERKMKAAKYAIKGYGAHAAAAAGGAAGAAGAAYGAKKGFDRFKKGKK